MRGHIPKKTAATIYRSMRKEGKTSTDAAAETLAAKRRGEVGNPGRPKKEQPKGKR